MPARTKSFCRFSASGSTVKLLRPAEPLLLLKLSLILVLGSGSFAPTCSLMWGGTGPGTTCFASDSRLRKYFYTNLIHINAVEVSRVYLELSSSKKYVTCVLVVVARIRPEVANFVFE